MSMSFAMSSTFISLLAFGFYSKFSEYCYFSDNEPYKLYASKTSYEQIRGRDERKVNLPGCTPILFYFLSRHGVRYPSNEDTTYMLKRLPQLQDLIINSNGKLCNADLKELEKWKLSFNPLCRDLTDEGKLELSRIANRFVKRFPSFVRDEDTRYDVRYMSGTRIISSLKNFLKGFWDLRQDLWQKVELKNDDKMLYFDKNCPKWNKSQTVIFERATRVMDKYFMVLQKRIAARIGLAQNISTDDVYAMYNACRFEVAWFPKRKSAWCAIFREDDLELLEFIKDVEFYVKYGFESEINYEQACPMVRDIVENMELATKGSKPTVLIRFSHSGAMVKFFTRLGLFNDTVSILNFDERNSFKRLWKTSFLDPFASNLCLVLFKCGDNFRILSYLQERLISIPVHCSLPCSLQELLNYYKPIANSCNLTKICHP